MMMRNSSCSSLNTTSSSDGEGAAPAAAGTTIVLKKGPWTAAEDAILMEYVQKHGEGNWNSVQKNSGLARCGKSCRLRWANHLRPNLKKGSFTPDEEMLILQLHAQLGNKWARMAAQLPGRTDNEIKNYWNTRVKRRQRAGMPLCPTDLQLQQAAHAQAHHYHRRSMGSLRPPPPSSSSAPSSPFQQQQQQQHSSLLHSPSIPVLMLPDYMMPEAPRVKRVRDDGLTFQFPLSPAVSQQHHYHQMAANNNNNMLHYNCLPLPSMPMARMELPSTQLFNNGGGGGESTCGLLDAMLQDPMGDGGGNENGRNNGGWKDSFEFEESSQCSDGINATRERPEEMNAASPDDDISKVFDMILTAGMPAAAAPEWYNTAASEWYNNTTTASGYGEQSSAAAAGDEVGLELQHMASSLSVAAPAEQEWNIGSCTWSNMPRIC